MLASETPTTSDDVLRFWSEANDSVYNAVAVAITEGNPRNIGELMLTLFRRERLRRVTNGDVWQAALKLHNQKDDA